MLQGWSWVSVAVVLDRPGAPLIFPCNESFMVVDELKRTLLLSLLLMLSCLLL